MKKYSSGFAILEGLLIAVIVAILAGTVVFVYKSNKNTSDSLKNIGSGEINIQKKQPQDTASTAPKTSEFTIVPDGGKAIKLTAPSGWALDGGTGSDRIVKTIGKYKYTLSFQINEEDYLKMSSYAVNKGDVLVQVNESNGQPVYIAKSFGSIVFSTCEPSGGKGCSFTQDGKSLFAIVTTPDPSGSNQAPGEINFSDSSADMLVEDLKTIVESLDI